MPYSLLVWPSSRTSSCVSRSLRGCISSAATARTTCCTWLASAAQCPAPPRHPSYQRRCNICNICSGINEPAVCTRRLRSVALPDPPALPWGQGVPALGTAAANLLCPDTGRSAPRCQVHAARRGCGGAASVAAGRRCPRGGEWSHLPHQSGLGSSTLLIHTNPHYTTNRLLLCLCAPSPQ